MSGRVVIVGGGVAGLETLLALHDLAGNRAEVTLVAPDPDFLYKPLLVEEPFDLGPAERHTLEPVAEELGARFQLGSMRRVNAAAHALDLDGDQRLDYDYAVVCTGGRFHPAFDGVTTFPAREPLRINELLRADGPSRHIFFVVPSGRHLGVADLRNRPDDPAARARARNRG